MPMPVKLMPLRTILSPRIDQRFSFVRFLKSLGTKRVDSTNELLVREPVAVKRMIIKRGISIPLIPLLERPLQWSGHWLNWDLGTHSLLHLLLFDLGLELGGEASSSLHA
jgi:hypothetical protein